MQIQTLYYLLAFAGGAIAGSFLNVCIYRLPRGISLRDPARSRCPQCGGLIRWWQNIPLLSYLLLGGRCHDCRRGISARYPAVELLTAAVTLLLLWQYGLTLALATHLLVAWILILISFIDAAHHIIPDRLVMLLAAIWGAANLLGGWMPWAAVFPGALYAAALLLGVRGVAGAMLRRESMGLGDVKLAAFLGAYLGWGPFLISLFVAAWIAVLLVLLRQLWAGGKLPDTVPFGPFMSLGAFIVLLFGDQLVDGYLQWLHGLIG